jgi:hypothetical protein
MPIFVQEKNTAEHFLTVLPKLLPGLREIFLLGSCRRGTFLRAKHDLDFCMVLNDRDFRRFRILGPDKSLNILQEVVKGAFPKSFQVRVQNRSIGVCSSEGGEQYDFVPAFPQSTKGKGVYIIPDRNKDDWILTSPEGHLQASKTANRLSGHTLNLLIRTAKSWSFKCGKPLSSFHLETMAYSSFKAPPRSFLHGLIDLFTHLSKAILDPCPDPAGLGPPVDDNVSDKDRVVAGMMFSQALSYLETYENPCQIEGCIV